MANKHRAIEEIKRAILEAKDECVKARLKNKLKHLQKETIEK